MPSHPQESPTADFGITFRCISNHLTMGECILAQLTSLGILVNIIQPSCSKRELRLLLLAVTGTAIVLSASWGVFPYHYTTLRNLIKGLEHLATTYGEVLQGIQESLDSLANVILDNYLLIEQNVVGTVTDKTCCR